MSARTRIIFTVGILLLAGISLQVLFDPLSSAKHSIDVQRVRAEFPQAQAKWDSQAVTHYRFEIKGESPFICSPDAIIEVKDEAVVRVEAKSPSSQPPQLLAPYEWADPDWGEEIFLCNHANFTMTEIFDLVEQTLKDHPSTILQADFDPEYGFVTYFRWGLFLPHGLLSPQLSDESDSFHITKFEPLNP